MKIGLFILVVFCIVSCGQSTEGEKDDSTLNAVDSSQSKVIKRFLYWYKDYEKNLSDTTFVLNFNSQKYDSTKHFAVNFKGTEGYLDDFSTSGFVTQEYLNKWRRYFSTCDSLIKIHPQNDAPPDGFESDFVFNSPDYMDNLADIEKIKFEFLANADNVSEISVVFPNGNDYIYHMVKENGLWKIASINNGFDF